MAVKYTTAIKMVQMGEATFGNLESLTSESKIPLLVSTTENRVDGIIIDSDSKVWLSYAKKVECISFDEFYQKFTKEPAQMLTAIAKSEVKYGNRKFILSDFTGDWERFVNEYELELFVNIDEPHSGEWTPCFVTDDLKVFALNGALKKSFKKTFPS